MWTMNLGKPLKIPKLNEAMAIELGASLLSEVIIFLIAAALLVAEVNRQTRKEARKESARRQELGHIQYSIHELYIQSKRQEQQIQEILRILSDLESKVMKIPLKGKPSEGTSLPKPLPNTKPGTDSIKDINFFQQEGLNYFINDTNYYHREGFRTMAQASYWWPESRGVVFTAVAYLSKDVF